MASGDGGFALIEAIAVLALSALVLLCLLVVSHLVTRNSAAATRRADAVENLGTGLEALRHDVASAKFARGGRDAKDPVLFEGTAKTVGFVSGSDGTAQGGAESLIWIESRAAGNGNALVRTSAQLLPQVTDFAGAQFGNPVVLLQGPWSYRFSFAEIRAGALTWQPGWSGRQTPPHAVRLEVFDRTGAAPALPPVVISLHIDAETKCEGDGCAPAENPDEQSPEGKVDVPEGGDPNAPDL